MGKITLSDDLKLKIANTTGLTYLAQSIEAKDVSDGNEVAGLLRYYATAAEASVTVNEDILPTIKEQNPEFAYDGEEPKPEPEMVTVTVVPTPSDATVKINDVEQSTIEVAVGTEIAVEVSKEGFVTKSETYIIEAAQTIEIALVAEQPTKVILTVNTLPAGATVKLNGEERISIEVDPGTEVTYEISKDGYFTKTGTFTVTETKTETVELVQMVTLTIVPTPSDATVKLNEVEQSAITVEPGAIVVYEVSKEDYTTKSDSIVVNETQSLPVELVAVK